MSKVLLARALLALNEIADNNRCECGDAEYTDESGKTQLCAGLYEDGRPFFCAMHTAHEARMEIRAELKRVPA